MSVILGLNAYHPDSSACLVVDGVLKIAIEEERLNRIKHWSGLPVLSIKECLASQNMQISDVTHIAINSDDRVNLPRKLWYTIKNRPDIGYILKKLAVKNQRSNINEEINNYFNGGVVASLHKVEHHLAHLYSACYVSPFEQSISMSIDGFGDFCSFQSGVFIDGNLELVDKVYFPHSLGIFYQAMTQYIGFKGYGDEYKVMGLAPYGKPVYLDKLRDVVSSQKKSPFKLNLDYFSHHQAKINFTWDDEEPSFPDFYTDKLEELLGKSRISGAELTQHHMDIASSTQVTYENIVLEYTEKILKMYPDIKNVTLAGGCAMNSVANGKIKEKLKVSNVYIQPAAGDAGGAIGAAYYVWDKVLGEKRHYVQRHAYLGPSFNNFNLKQHFDSIKNNTEEFRITLFDGEELFKHTAKKINEGKVVGWFQGAMEWGPRALGNRSILADPRRTDMKDILNLKIKRRESFRPFAPSIMQEHVSNWFEVDDYVPFMMKVYKIKADKRKIIPAVAHVDGTGRLQSVNPETNSRYYNLISEFNKISNVPMLLNTSFNENEPIVCKPEEAVNTFLRTNMDCLVINDWVVERV